MPRAVAAVLASLLLAACAPLAGASPGPTSPPSPAIMDSAEPTPSPQPTPDSQASGLARFDAHGIAFDYPATWTDVAAAVKPNWGTRIVTYLVEGTGPCETPLVAPSVGLWPACLGGLGGFVVTEFINPGPLVPQSATAATVGGHPGWLLSNAAARTWLIQGDAGNEYLLEDRSRAPAGAARAAAIDALLATVRFSPSPEPALPLVDGRSFLDTRVGVSFSFPPGWLVYYPQTPSMMDSSLVLVASMPIQPCVGTVCQSYVVPPGGIAVEFRVGAGVSRPDWSTAPVSVGGQPAFRYDWTGPNAHDAQEGHSWNVRFGTRELGIYASLSGPGLPALQGQLNDLLDSISLDPSQLP